MFKKIMFISDIHLRAYHRYNKFPDQRLMSFIELAKDLVEKGKAEGITDLIIGGDLIDKSTLTPREIHVLFNMYTILVSQFNVYSIVGNHDMKMKKGEFERNDSLVTLLEEITGSTGNKIKFYHQEILTIGNRSIAFENWMPEFDLSWIKDPVDMYVSHATIDYDKTGFYGMDTTVFEGKFKLGFFGDIHVRRQIENYISIGNTKQESLSDRFQGGGIILNTEDLTWERFDIDPEHKKYLHLVPTDDLDLEGWVDSEGEDMTYRIYKPAKVKDKTVSFTLPKTTDIENKLNIIMKDLGLIDLHNSIKSATNYTPIDFNFKLNKLIIKNFRSISDYVLDFDKDYVVTGPNGSGKSTMITALFYALIGKKTLKQEVSFGEKECKLTLHLTYQKQDFVIVRGTGSGEYGLSINKVDQKYNNKLEFEKDVYLHLPFLNYHEAIFFNYWDTELLGTMKLDRRFDLVAKFFRLDALADYFDLASIKLKEAKKALKESKDEFDKVIAKYEYTKQLKDIIEDELKDAKPKKDLLTLMDNYKLKREYNKDLVLLIDKRSSYVSNFNSALNDKNISESNVKYNEDKLKKSVSKESLELSLSNYKLRSQLQVRYDKGTSLIESEKTSVSIKKAQLDAKKVSLSLINVGDILPEISTSHLEELSKTISDLSSKFSNELYVYTKNIEKYEADILKINKEIEDTSKITNCSGCGKPLSMEDKIKTYVTFKESLEESLRKELVLYELSKKNDEEFRNVTSVALNKERDELLGRINEVKAHNKRVRDNSELVSSLNSDIKNIETLISDSENKLDTYVSTLNSIEIEMRSTPFISEEENISNQILLSSYSDLEKSKVLYEEKLNYFLKIEELYKTETVDLDKKISDIEIKLIPLDGINEDLNLEAALTVSKYNDKELYESRIIKEDKEIKSSEKKISILENDFNSLDTYCQLTSRSGDVLKSTLEDLTKTFSNGEFRFSTNKAQASGKLVTDMSVEYLVGKQWVTYPALSSGQKTLCDLYFISKVVTGVGIMSFDETLRFLDDENMKIASDLIVDIKKHNLIISTHSPNLYIEGITTLLCKLNKDSRTVIQEY